MRSFAECSIIVLFSALSLMLVYIGFDALFKLNFFDGSTLYKVFISICLVLAVLLITLSIFKTKNHENN